MVRDFADLAAGLCKLHVLCRGGVGDVDEPGVGEVGGEGDGDCAAEEGGVCE